MATDTICVGCRQPLPNEDEPKPKKFKMSLPAKLALVFTAVPLAWAVAAAVAGLYALWCARFWRALATGTRELARQRLRRDPRLRVRLGCAGALLLAGLAAGAYRAPGAGQRLALVAVLLLLLVAAGVAAVVVDARTARIHDEAGPEEHGEARIGPLLLRWYVAAGLAAVVPCMLAMDRVGWILRAATGTACIAALVGYLRWSAVRWPRPVLPLGLLGLSRGASAATGLLAVYLPAAAYLPARAADVLSAPALVLIAGALLGAVVWSLVATARRLRRGWTSRAPSARRPAA